MHPQDIDDDDEDDRIFPGKDACPNCGTMSYVGGWCFGCNKYREDFDLTEMTEEETE